MNLPSVQRVTSLRRTFRGLRRVGIPEDYPSCPAGGDVCIRVTVLVGSVRVEGSSQGSGSEPASSRTPGPRICLEPPFGCRPTRRRCLQQLPEIRRKFVRSPTLLSRTGILAGRAAPSEDQVRHERAGAGSGGGEMGLMARKSVYATGVA